MDEPHMAAPRRHRRIHPAWWVAAIAFIALLAAAGFHAAPWRPHDSAPYRREPTTEAAA
ncbi:hypothetical protein [Brevibacterium siliguriense]|uniref:hypothetical protein n=1 Tax=Brevibacterium siliguriense TaxID=1136497 RepID=UPI0014289E01|nr:hypothetical protein [Brevibacterium siliguriense]